MVARGFVPPPYPQDRLVVLRRLADARPGGVVDCSVGTPIDPLPEVARRALVESAPAATGYPPSIGSPALREAAAGWIDRRFGVTIGADDVIACIGTKEMVASLPKLLHLRNPTRDTILYPAVSYPTYDMGAQLAGLRAVAVPVDTDWRLDLSRVAPDDAQRALILWLNEPANPTGATMGAARVQDAVAWARARGIVVASDECYAEFTFDADGTPGVPATVLHAGADGVLAVHSLSKRSNMAGLRAGFVAGDPELVGYLGEVRKHAGLMVPAPVQAAAAAALGDDAHVDAQRARYAQRRALVLDGLDPLGFLHDGGPSTFYLWLRGAEGTDDGWELAGRLAEAGTLVAPGDLYGPGGADHVRLSLTQPIDRLELALDRLTRSAAGAA
ncbi:MAG TPA: succinyldiaminopimelate transaminase [Acidimicrobiia bacterium]|nr:succinyldiaminopimelate transaminase [Acidimicrobiia bacterium]